MKEGILKFLVFLIVIIATTVSLIASNLFKNAYAIVAFGIIAAAFASLLFHKHKIVLELGEISLATLLIATIFLVIVAVLYGIITNWLPTLYGFLPSIIHAQNNYILFLQSILIFSTFMVAFLVFILQSPAEEIFGYVRKQIEKQADYVGKLGAISGNIVYVIFVIMIIILLFVASYSSLLAIASYNSTNATRLNESEAYAHTAIYGSFNGSFYALLLILFYVLYKAGIVKILVDAWNKLGIKPQPPK